jgi:REP element-mobilizing transposase RayT
VTIVAYGREHLFGEIVNGEMKLNRNGQIVRYVWIDLPKHYPHLELDAFCMMPNHMHFIIVLDAGNQTLRHPLSEIIRALKTFSAKRINALCQTLGIPVWQRNYYEHIIRNERDYQIKRNYILNNPANWENDRDMFDRYSRS